MGTEERCRRQVPEGGSVGLGGRCPVLRWIDDPSDKLTARAVASAFMSLRTNALQPDYCNPAAQPPSASTLGANAKGVPLPATLYDHHLEWTLE